MEGLWHVCWHHFSRGICSIHVSVSHAAYFRLFIIIIIIVTTDQWSLVSLLQFTENSANWHFLSIKYF